jgi:hypothetical protein
MADYEILNDWMGLSKGDIYRSCGYHHDIYLELMVELGWAKEIKNPTSKQFKKMVLLKSLPIKLDCEGINIDGFVLTEEKNCWR